MLTQQSKLAHTEFFYYHINNGNRQCSDTSVVAECRFGLLIKNPNHVTHIIIYLSVLVLLFPQKKLLFFLFAPSSTPVSGKG